MTQYEVVLNGVSPSGKVLTVLNYDIVGDLPLDFQAFSDAIGQSISANLIDAMAPSCGYSGITLRLDQPGEVGQTFDFSGGFIFGSANDNQYASQMACIVRKLASNLARPNKGRIYQGMLTSEAFTQNGLWSQLIRDIITLFWVDMIQVNFTGNGIAQMQIKASNPLAPNTVPYNPVSTVAVQANPATQRRRRLGSGV